MGKFGKQVQRFADKHDKRLRAIARTAVQDTIEIAQHPMRDGGRMRIKTSFLRASIQAAINRIPSGPTQPKKNAKDNEYLGKQVAGEPLPVALLRWDIIKGDQIYIGWTANYARPREYKDGFLRTAVGRWDSTVRRAVKKIEATFG